MKYVFALKKFKFAEWGVESKLGPLGTSATEWPIVPAPGDYDDGEFGGMMIDRGNRSTRRKPAPVPLYAPQIPLDQTRVWTRAAAVGSQRLTAWDMARPICINVHCLRRIINIRWPETISNEDPWTVTNQQPIVVQIKERKWNWIRHTLRKPTEAVEKIALDWNPQGARRCSRPRKTWRKTVEEEAREAGKTWNEVKWLTANRTRWRSFTDALCSRRSYRTQVKSVSH
jgi:hypothetical protein